MPDPTVVHEFEIRRGFVRTSVSQFRGQRYIDVRTAILRDRRANTAYEVHYPASHEWDVHHAEHLEGVPGLELHAHREKEHQFVQALQRSGELVRMVRAAIDG